MWKLQVVGEDGQALTKSKVRMWAILFVALLLVLLIGLHEPTWRAILNPLGGITSGSAFGVKVGQSRESAVASLTRRYDYFFTCPKYPPDPPGLGECRGLEPGMGIDYFSIPWGGVLTLDSQDSQVVTVRWHINPGPDL